MSSASKGPLDIQFLPGIRQDLSAHVAPPGTLKSARNVRYGRQGGIFPRPGTSSLGTTTDTATHIISSAGEVGWINTVGSVGLVGASGKAFAYDDVSSRFRFRGMYSSVQPVRKRRGLISEASASGGGFASRYGIATMSSGATLVAASDGTEVHYYLETDGVISLYGTVTGTECAVVATSSAFFLVVQASLTLTAFEITPGTSPTISSGATVGTLSVANHFWDVTPHTDGAQWYLAHQTSTTNVRLDRFLITTSQANASITVAAGRCAVSLFANATGLWVGLYEAMATVRYAVRNSATLALVLAATTIETSANRGAPLFGAWTGASTTAFFVYARTGAAAVAPYATRYGTASSAGVVSTVLDAWSSYPISKPDDGQRFWAVTSDYALGNPTSTQRCVLLRVHEISSTSPPTLELSAPQFTSKGEVPIGTAGEDYFHHVAVGATTRVFALPRVYRTEPNLGGAGYLIGLEVLEYETFTQAASRSTVDLGTTVAVSGQPIEIPGHGTARTVSGSTIADAGFGGGLEIGFPQRPRIISAVGSNGAGALTVSGSYSYLAVYEHIDPLGRRHRSAASSAQAVTLGASDDTVTLTIATLGFGQQLYAGAIGGTAIVFTRVHVYRTANGGSTYFRVTPGNGAPAGWDPTDGTVTFTDLIADGSLSAEFIYTDGGVKDNALAPACRVLFATDNRLAAALGWDRNVITYSKAIVPVEPPQFTDDDGFRVFFPEDLEAAAFMDGGTAGFSKRAIYAVSGDGPNDQGIGQFSEPRVIAQGIGATSEVTLVTELGILFFNTRGWYLLPRGFGAPVFVGSAIQELTAPGAYDTPVGAVVHQDGLSRTAHLSMTNAAGSEGIVLVLDLDVRTPEGMPAWSFDTFAASETPSGRLATTVIGPWPDGILLANDGFRIFDESRSADADTGLANISTAVQTTALRPFGLGGWGRVGSFTLLASDPDGASTLTMRCTPDDATASGTAGYTEQSWTLSAASGSLYRQVVCANVQATAWTVDVTVERTSEMGPTLHGVTLELNQESGARRVSAAER